MIYQLRKALLIPRGPLSWPFTPVQQGTGQRVSSRKWVPLLQSPEARIGVCTSVSSSLAGLTWAPAQALSFGACSVSQMIGNGPWGHHVTSSKSCPFLGFSFSKQQPPLTQHSLCRPWAEPFVQWLI